MKIPSSRTIFYSILFFIAGIPAFSFISDGKAILLFIFFFFFLFFFFEKHEKAILIFGLFFILGITRAYFFELSFQNSDLQNFYNQEITFTGKVIKKPDIREKNVRLVIGNIKILDKYFKKEKIIVFSDKHLNVGTNGVLEIKGKISKPETFDEFDYEGYLKTNGISAVSFYPQVRILEEGHSFIFSFKEKMRKTLYKNISFPESTILGAMILGDKGRIPEEWLLKLSSTGVRHITAVSGMHVAIISSILISIFSRANKKISTFFIISFLFFFVLLTGFQASAIRAGLLALSVLVSRMIGRKSSPLRATILIAFLMLVVNPNLLIHDVGFQLSFLSFIGISVFSEKIEKSISFLPSFLSSPISVTISAFILSFPIVIYHFKEVPIMFLPTNVIVSFFIYPIMFLGIIFLILSQVSYPIAYLFLLPLRIFMNLFTKTVSFFSNLFITSSRPINLSIIEVIFLYLILLIFYYFYIKKEKDRIESIDNLGN